MKKGYCSRLDGLALKDILPFLMAMDNLRVYLPEEHEIVKCGRSWIVDIATTIVRKEFEDFVISKEMERRSYIDKEYDLQVSFIHAQSSRCTCSPNSPTRSRPRR